MDFYSDHEINPYAIRDILEDLGYDTSNLRTTRELVDFYLYLQHGHDWKFPDLSSPEIFDTQNRSSSYLSPQQLYRKIMGPKQQSPSGTQSSQKYNYVDEERRRALASNLPPRSPYQT